MSEQTPRLTHTGDLIDGRYELVRPLARGGMARIWRARDRRLGREVAVKILDPKQLGDPLHAARMQVEAQALAHLSHPHIAVIHDAGTVDADGQMPYLVMELVHGKPLSALARYLPWPAAAGVVAQVADALSAAHASGVVHRDVSAANVLLTTSGVKLIDFGICAMTGDDDSLDDGRIMGTIAYLPPERIVGTPVAPAIDVFGLGVLLYLLLTGDFPWPREGSPAEELKAVLHRGPAPSIRRPDVPARIRQACLQCLHPDPLRRPTAAEVATVLRDAGAHWDSDVATTLLGQRELDPQTLRLAGSAAPQRSTEGRRLAVTAAAACVVGLAAWGLSGWTPAPSAQLQAVAPGVAADPSRNIACQATYRTTKARNGRFTAIVTILNLGTQAVPTGWRLRLSLPGQPVLDQSARSTWLETANGVATNADPGPIAPHQPQQLSLAGAYTSAVPHPDGVWLNEKACAATVIDPAPARSTAAAANGVPAPPPPEGKPAKPNGKGPKHKTAHLVDVADRPSETNSATTNTAVSAAKPRVTG
jgi:eukaryotic-like serine/threonine-protein kinase